MFAGFRIDPSTDSTLRTLPSIIPYIDFTPKSLNTFLQDCGVRTDPPVAVLASILLDDPAKVYQNTTQKEYLSVLERIADAFDELKGEFEARMRAETWLVSEGGEEGLCPEGVFWIDDPFWNKFGMRRYVIRIAISFEYCHLDLTYVRFSLPPASRNLPPRSTTCTNHLVRVRHRRSGPKRPRLWTSFRANKPSG